MPGKLWSKDKLRTALENVGVERVMFEAWQEEYIKVWGRKGGTSEPVGAQPIERYLRCPACAHVAFTYTPPTFICGHCGRRIPVGMDGVLEVG
jgi:hypothetical protein